MGKHLMRPQSAPSHARGMNLLISVKSVTLNASQVTDLTDMTRYIINIVRYCIRGDVTCRQLMIAAKKHELSVKSAVHYDLKVELIS